MVAAASPYRLWPEKMGKQNQKRMPFLTICGHTDLLIGQSKATHCKESADDVKIGVALQKPQWQKHGKTREISRQKVFDIEKQNVGNRPKHVFAKF